MMDQDGNTPKVRARALVEKFIEPQELKCDTKAKSRAKICCNEIINYEFFGSTTQEYFRRVLAEIEKL